MSDRNLKLLLVVGARPQFIKAAVLCRAVQAHNAAKSARQVELELLHTGQHYDDAMSRVFFQELDLPEPAINLGVGSGPHGEVTGRMLAGIEVEIIRRKPDAVITVGDTNSTLAGALAAAKLNVPSAHVEAGLRSFRRSMPEEINRIVADRVSDLLFCPSERSARQLGSEGITNGVHVTGDVMFDSILHYCKRAVYPERESPFALATLHRAENVDDENTLRELFGALDACPVPVLLPLHPRTRSRIDAMKFIPNGSLEFRSPLSFFEMMGHLKRCSFVATDSGGLQKEAFYMGKRCVTLRNETEWMELVELGANRIAGVTRAGIAAQWPWAIEPLEISAQPYGDGTAGTRIIRILSEAFSR